MSSSPLATLYQKFGKSYPEGSTVFLENEPGQEMFIILSGQVEIYKRVEVRKKVGSTWVRQGTQDKVLAVLKPGDFFGEMSLLNDKPRSASARALTETKLIVLNRSNFELILEAQPKLTVKMLKSMSNRVRDLDKLVGWVQGVAGEMPVPSQEAQEGKAEEPPTEEKQSVEPKPTAPKAPPGILSPEAVDGFLRSFWRPRVILEALEVKLFDHLQDPLTAEQAAEKIGGNVEMTRAVLDALCSMGLVLHTEEGYMNMPVASRAFVSESEGYIGGTLGIHRQAWEGLTKLAQAWKEGPLLKEPEAKIRFRQRIFDALGAGAADATDVLVNHLPQLDIRRFVEISQVPASFAAEISRLSPQAEGIVVEDKALEEITQQFLDTFGLKDKVTVQTIEAEKAVFPQNQDLVVISLQSLRGKETLRALFEKAHACLKEGGALLFHDFLQEPQGASEEALYVLLLHNLFIGPACWLLTSEVSEIARAHQLTEISQSATADGTSTILFRK